MIIRIIALLLIVFVIGWIIRRRLQPGHHFQIRVTDRGVEVQGRVPTKGASDVQHYIRSLGLPLGATITGQRDGQTDFRLDFSGNIRADDCQRVRNYLHNY